MSAEYESFLASKRFVCPPAGIQRPPEISSALFPFQRDIVRWALRRGRAAIWADCFLPGSLVKADGTYRPIEECREGMSIETLRGPSTIERAMSRPHDGPTVTIKTASAFFPMTVTDSHKFYVLRDDRIQIVGADELCLTDHLLYRQPKTERGTHAESTAFLRFLGIWLAEGWVSSYRGTMDRVHLGFHLKEESTLVAQAFTDLTELGYSPHIERGKEKKNVLLVSARAYDLAARLTSECGKLAGGKRLPPWFGNLSDDHKLTVLRALFQGDAHIHRRPDGDSGRLSDHIKWVTISYELASGVRDALLSLGIRCSGMTEAPKTDASGTNHRRCFRLLIPRRFMPRFGFETSQVQRKDLRLTEVADHETGELYTLIAIRKISRGQYAGPVYNLTSAGHDSYLTDAGTSKNCGLGKGFMAQEWARIVATHSKRPVLILAPLGVAQQFKSEAAKFGAPINACGDGSEIRAGVNVTNYERLHRFDPSVFGGVVIDESSCLKDYTSTTRNTLIDAFQNTPFRLACTATPAPNDHMELGNHAEFLGIMSRVEMLSMFFVHDGGDTQQWRLKGHARTAFWKWLCSWACSIRRPSDLGYDDGAYRLPPLNIIEHVVPVGPEFAKAVGTLFITDAAGLEAQRAARRASLDARVRVAVELANASKESWLIWCDLNEESEKCAEGIEGAVEVAGSHPAERKEANLLGFAEGAFRVLVSKSSIAGHGMNYQHCSNVAFVGLSNSFEAWYQAVRRTWRFGQTNDVNCHLIVSDVDGGIRANLERKRRDAEQMADEMLTGMGDIQRAEIGATDRETETYAPATPMRIPSWLRTETTT